MGPRKMVYPLRKERNFCAEARIFHYDVLLVEKARWHGNTLELTGTQSQAPMIAAKI